MSHLGSYKASESSCQNGFLQAGAGTLRNELDLPQAPSLEEMMKPRPNLLIS